MSLDTEHFDTPKVMPTTEHDTTPSQEVAYLSTPIDDATSIQFQAESIPLPRIEPWKLDEPVPEVVIEYNKMQTDIYRGRLEKGSERVAEILNDRLAKYQAYCDQIPAQQEAVKMRVAEKIQHDIDHFNMIIESATAQVEALERRLELLKNERVSELSTNVQEAEIWRQAVQRSATNVYNDIVARENALKEHENRRDAAAATIEALVSEKAQLDNELSTTHKKLAQYQETIDGFTLKREKLEARITELEHLIATEEEENQAQSQAMIHERMNTAMEEDAKLPKEEQKLLGNDAAIRAKFAELAKYKLPLSITHASNLNQVKELKEKSLPENARFIATYERLSSELLTKIETEISPRLSVLPDEIKKAQQAYRHEVDDVMLQMNASTMLVDYAATGLEDASNGKGFYPENDTPDEESEDSIGEKNKKPTREQILPTTYDFKRLARVSRALITSIQREAQRDSVFTEEVDALSFDINKLPKVEWSDGTTFTPPTFEEFHRTSAVKAEATAESPKSSRLRKAVQDILKRLMKQEEEPAQSNQLAITQGNPASERKK